MNIAWKLVLAIALLAPLAVAAASGEAAQSHASAAPTVSNSSDAGGVKVCEANPDGPITKALKAVDHVFDKSEAPTSGNLDDPSGTQNGQDRQFKIFLSGFTRLGGA